MGWGTPGAFEVAVGELARQALAQFEPAQREVILGRAQALAQLAQAAPVPDTWPLRFTVGTAQVRYRVRPENRLLLLLSVEPTPPP
jgi:hypothetical protein